MHLVGHVATAHPSCNSEVSTKRPLSHNLARNCRKTMSDFCSESMHSVLQPFSESRNETLSTTLASSLLPPCSQGHNTVAPLTTAIATRLPSSHPRHTRMPQGAPRPRRARRAPRKPRPCCSSAGSSTSGVARPPLLDESLRQGPRARRTTSSSSTVMFA